MVAIFKTNVLKKKDAKLLVTALQLYFPLSCINFDLQDCDKILRIDALEHFPEQVIDIINEHGFSCVEIE